VRVDRGPRFRIKAEYGTPEFDAEYHAAISGTPSRKSAPSNSSLAWLLARYRETTAWSELSRATRRSRDNIFKGVIETAGHQPYARITADTILAGKERRATTPHQARNFLDAMRGLFRWAHKAKLIKVDPTAGVYNPKCKGGPGFIAWTEKDAAAYEAAPGSEFGWTFCYIPAFVVAMPCGLAASMSGTALRPSRLKRAD
jgi:hypothetical protein